MLVGALQENASGCEFDVAESWRRAAEELGALRPIQTTQTIYSITQRQFGASLGGPYGGVNFQQVHSPVHGHFEKRDLIQEWEDVTVFNPRSLNKPWGLILSICTGHAERIPLRIVVGEVLVQYMLDHIIDWPSQLGFSGDSCQNFWRALQDALIGRGHKRTRHANAAWCQWVSDLHPLQRKYAKIAIIYVLQHLKHTGYNPTTKVFRVAWPGEQQPHYGFDLPCSRSSPFQWLKFLEDSPRTATFAVATRDCLVAHSDSRVKFGPFDSCRWTRLQTRILAPDEFKLVHTKILPARRKRSTAHIGSQ